MRNTCTCLAYSDLLDFVSIITWATQYISWSSSLCNCLQSHVTPPPLPLGPNTFSSTKQKCTGHTVHMSSGTQNTNTQSSATESSRNSSSGQMQRLLSWIWLKLECLANVTNVWSTRWYRNASRCSGSGTQGRTDRQTDTSVWYKSLINHWEYEIFKQVAQTQIFAVLTRTTLCLHVNNYVQTWRRRNICRPITTWHIQRTHDTHISNRSAFCVTTKRNTQ